MNVKLDPGAFMPTRAHENDAGLDLYAPSNMIIFGGCGATIDTGVHVELPPNTVGMVKSKSGLMVKHNLVTDGTVDESYRGSIRVKLFNHSGSSYDIKRGDKIAQLVVLPVLYPTLELVDELSETDRGSNGFGSTGR